MRAYLRATPAGAAQMVDEKFRKAGKSVWQHVVIGYSKCNAFETSWRGGLEKKKLELCKSIREKVRAAGRRGPGPSPRPGGVHPGPRRARSAP